VEVTEMTNTLAYYGTQWNMDEKFYCAWPGGSLSLALVETLQHVVSML
jgi:hypothetical protein